MKIVFDTNPLFDSQLIKDKLPHRLSEFLKSCKDNGHEIIIPLTTLLEFNRKQRQHLDTEHKNIRWAEKKLASYKIKVSRFKIERLVKPPDLVTLIKDLGLKCDVVKPTKKNYENAHRRACLKENPHPAIDNSDHMKDLVIWEIALKIAHDNDGAILISKDKILGHPKGDVEASQVNLFRFEDIDRALEALDIETESAKIIKKIFEKKMSAIIMNEKLRLKVGAQLVSIKQPRFRDNEDGTTSVNADISMRTGDGKVLSSRLRMNYMNDLPFLVEFSQAKVDNDPLGDPITIEFEKPATSKEDFNERLSSLKELIGD